MMHSLQESEYMQLQILEELRQKKYKSVGNITYMQLKFFTTLLWSMNDFPLWSMNGLLMGGQSME